MTAAPFSYDARKESAYGFCMKLTVLLSTF